MSSTRVKHKLIMIMIIMMINVNDKSVNDITSSNEMIILQPPKVIATLTIMIITTTIIIIIATKIRAITTINSIDFTRISHHLVLHSKSASDYIYAIKMSQPLDLPKFIQIMKTYCAKK